MLHIFAFIGNLKHAQNAHDMQRYLMRWDIWKVVLVTIFNGWNESLLRFHSCGWIHKNRNLHKHPQFTDLTFTELPMCLYFGHSFVRAMNLFDKWFFQDLHRQYDAKATMIATRITNNYENWLIHRLPIARFVLWR